MSNEEHVKTLGEIATRLRNSVSTNYPPLVEMATQLEAIAKDLNEKPA